ncbi:MAG: ABC transporter permease [Dehalococcoidia bacterium]
MAHITPSGLVGGEVPEERDEARRAASLAALDRGRLRSTPGLYRRAWRRFRQNHVAMVSLAILTLIVLFVAGADAVSELTGFTSSENHLDKKLTRPFSDGYLLGADGNGRDILTRLAYGGRVSLLIALLATATTMLIGVSLGLISGYFGGLIDAFIMRAVDVLLALPTLPLLILIATLYAPTPTGLALILAATFWPGITRLIRGEVLTLRQRDYVEAARVVGARPARVLARHMLPNVTPIVIVWASLSVPDLILTEAALSFIGLGVRVPDPSWGNMLDEAARFYRTAWTNVFIPGLMIYLASLTMYLVGTGLRDALDPRLSD